MSGKLLERLTSNARHLIDTYPTANGLLHQAVKDAMPWAAPLAMKGVTPSLQQVETLATQLLAILMASEPKGETSTVAAVKDMRW